MNSALTNEELSENTAPDVDKNKENHVEVQPMTCDHQKNENFSPLESQTKDLTTSDPYNKTPISTLQEYCQKLSKTPQYDLTATEGRAHQPQFVFTCRVGDVTASGQGGSKKQAKHNAADAVLKMLTNHLMPKDSKESQCQDLQVAPSSNIPQKPDETNPVGSLQELVVARGWRLPEYSLAVENGPAHKKEFVICCTVENMKQYGSGSAKKHAKRLAAMNMLNLIINLPPDAKEKVTSDSKEAMNTTELNELVNTDNDKIQLPENIKKVKDARDQLEAIGKKSSFEIVYHNTHCKNLKGEFQCFVQLTTKPPVLKHGVGATMEEANLNAAENSIEHIKIFL